MKEASKDLTKEQLYESVKTLLEHPDSHLHLPQHKLFTLVSIAVQYFLFLSTKKPGIYIFRFENGHLVDKLTKKSKDPTTRKFLEKIFLPRKLIYNQSTFYLDFFHISSWSITNDLPKQRLQGALIVKDSSPRPLVEPIDDFSHLQQNSSSPLDTQLSIQPSEMSHISDQEHSTSPHSPLDHVSSHLYYTNLMERIPKTVIISFEKNYPQTEKILFPFIKEQEKQTQGVFLSSSFQWNSSED
jgi:hypothetical protein